MAETRKYPRSGRRAILSVDSLLEHGAAATLICAPIAALEVARKLIRDRGYWRTSYAKSYGDSSYTLPEDPDFEAIKASLDSFLEATNLMNCEDLITELDDIGNAITALGAQGGCGCGSGGAGETSPPINETDTGDITAPTGTPPPGYDDWEQYQVFKCDIATWIVNNMQSDMAWFQTIQIATLTLGGLSAGMLSILSAFTLTAILAGLLGILAYQITLLEDLENVVIDNFDDIVCALVGGTDVASSTSAFTIVMEDAIDAAVADTIGAWLLKRLVNSWTDTASFNLLYEDKGVVAGHQVPPGGDCVPCGIGCNNVYVAAGTWLGGGVYQGALLATNYHVVLHFNATGGRCTLACGAMELFSFEALSGYTPVASALDSFRVWSDAVCPFTDTNADVYSSDTIPPFGISYCGGAMEIFSDTIFTVTIDRRGKCT